MRATKQKQPDFYDEDGRPHYLVTLADLIIPCLAKATGLTEEQVEEKLAEAQRRIERGEAHGA